MGIKLDEAIKRYKNNAEYERTHGNLQGCLGFRQHAKWLEELRAYRNMYHADNFADCIHKLDFSIGAYQKLIDEKVDNGEVVGTGVRGTWTASTPLNKAYSDMIEALQTAKATMLKYQKIEQILDEYCNLEAWEVLEKIKKVVEDGNDD